jgi:hypothetical protein
MLELEAAKLELRYYVLSRRDRNHGVTEDTEWRLRRISLCSLPVHEAQLLTYLKLSQMKVGLLLNFNVQLMKDGITRRVL